MTQPLPPVDPPIRDEPMSVEDAKRRLLEFGELQSLKFQIQVEEFKRLAANRAMIAGGSALLGALLGGFGKRKRKSSDKDDADKKSSKTSSVSTIIRWLVRVGVPLAIRFLNKQQARRPAPVADPHEPVVD